MNFFFKKSKIHLDVFTTRAGVFELYPIEYGNKFFPEWWKNLPKEYYDGDNIHPSSTMKRCEGFIQYYKNSITIPLWSDLLFKINSNESFTNWQFSDKVTHASSHPKEQMEGFMSDSEFAHLKIESPWLFRCKEEVSWVWTQPMWNFKTPFDILIPPAIVDYKYNNSTNVNMLIRLTEDKEILLPAGLPMANLFPMTEKDVVIHKHLISKDEHSMLHDVTYPSTFVNKYKNAKKILQRKESKCPFHF